MNYCLADVEHAHVMISQYPGQRMDEARFVLACNVDEKDLGGRRRHASLLYRDLRVGLADLSLHHAVHPHAAHAGGDKGD